MFADLTICRNQHDPAVLPHEAVIRLKADIQFQKTLTDQEAQLMCGLLSPQKCMLMSSSTVSAESISRPNKEKGQNSCHIDELSLKASKSNDVDLSTCCVEQAKFEMCANAAMLRRSAIRSVISAARHQNYNHHAEAVAQGRVL